MMFGTEMERDPARVAADVRDGRVTPERARSAYGVIIDPATLLVDAPATAAARERRAMTRAESCPSALRQGNIT